MNIAVWFKTNKQTVKAMALLIAAMPEPSEWAIYRIDMTCHQCVLTLKETTECSCVQLRVNTHIAEEPRSS